MWLYWVTVLRILTSTQTIYSQERRGYLHSIICSANINDKIHKNNPIKYICLFFRFQFQIGTPNWLILMYNKLICYLMHLGEWMTSKSGFCTYYLIIITAECCKLIKNQQTRHISTHLCFQRVTSVTCLHGALFQLHACVLCNILSALLRRYCQRSGPWSARTGHVTRWICVHQAYILK